VTVNEITLTLGGSVELLLKPAPPEFECVVTSIYEGLILAARGYEMAYTLPADRMVVVRVDYVDGAGNPAMIDGPVTWDTSAAEVVTVDADDADSQQCTITATGLLGTAQVSAHADADLGSGTRALVTTLDVTTVAGEAVAGVISPVGEPQPIP
jgi:hypothetical protein